MQRAWAVLAILGACGIAVGCDELGPDDIASGSSELDAVTWTDTVQVLAEGNHLTKTGTTTTWSAGAVSVETIARAGFVDFTTDENTTAKMVGLSNGNADTGYAD